MPHRPELHSQIRALAHLLAAGQISWADYRERRAEAVTAIVDGEKPLVYSPAKVFDDPTTPGDRNTEQVYIDLEELERPPRRWPAVAAVAALGAVIVVGGWILLNPPPQPVVAAAPVVEMSRGEALIAAFVRADDWSGPAIDEMASGWQALPAEARTDARRTATWRRFQNQLREQINRQQVLASVDESGEAGAQEARLRALQESLAQD